MAQQDKFTAQRATTTQIFQIGIQQVPPQIQQLIPVKASTEPITDTMFLFIKIQTVDRQLPMIIRLFKIQMFIINRKIKMQAMPVLIGTLS